MMPKDLMPVSSPSLCKGQARHGTHGQYLNLQFDVRCLWKVGLTCLTEWEAERSWEPTVTRTGSARNSEASFWMAGGQVAENISVCLSARVWEAIARMCGSKPRSSIRSASSSTR